MSQKYCQEQINVSSMRSGPKIIEVLSIPVLWRFQAFIVQGSPAAKPTCLMRGNEEILG